MMLSLGSCLLLPGENKSALSTLRNCYNLWAGNASLYMNKSPKKV